MTKIKVLDTGNNVRIVVGEVDIILSYFSASHMATQILQLTKPYSSTAKRELNKQENEHADNIQ